MIALLILLLLTSHSFPPHPSFIPYSLSSIIYPSLLDYSPHSSLTRPSFLHSLLLGSSLTSISSLPPRHFSSLVHSSFLPPSLSSIIRPSLFHFSLTHPSLLSHSSFPSPLPSSFVRLSLLLFSPPLTCSSLPCHSSHSCPSPCLFSTPPHTPLFHALTGHTAFPSRPQ